MKNTVLIFLTLTLCFRLSAQKKTSSDLLTGSITYHYGIVMPHHKSISYLTEDQLSAFELNLGVFPSNNRDWVSLYNRPEIGIGIYHTSLSNDQIFGKATAVYPYISFPLKRNFKWDFNLQLGMGVAYTKKNFDPVTNYQNIAIGSKFNAFFKLMSSASYAVTDHWRLHTGIGFCHISNGSIQVPNKGLNMLTGNVGVKYIWKYDRANFQPSKPNVGKLKNQLILVWSNGIRQASEIDQHKYYTTSLSCNYGIGVNAKQRVGFGLDVFYDESINRGKWNLSPDTKLEDRLRQSLFLSHDLVIQKFTILANLGVYTLYKTKPPKPVYSRVGLRYQINKHLLANISLKAHMGKADFIEWGIGYKFNTRQNAN